MRRGREYRAVFGIIILAAVCACLGVAQIVQTNTQPMPYHDADEIAK